LHQNIRLELYSYIAGLFKAKNCACYQIGGADDHIHISCALPKGISISDLIKEIKTSTSVWIKSKDDSLANFYWQRGYGVFSLSPAHLKGLREYIASQEVHHRRVDFKDEFLRFLKKYNIDYDERYLWE